MLISGIKSKPVYSPLRADGRGRYHLMLGIGVGGEALLRVLEEMQSAAPRALGTTHVMYLPSATRDGATLAGLQRACVAPLKIIANPAALLAEFRSMLERSLMGTRVYVAGPESFIGLAMQVAFEFNLNKDEVRAEEMGSLARRVYCVHCRATTEDVQTNIVRCTGCDRWLLVRDHYSRRIAAYMGVMVDAEAPGELPPIKRIFV